MKRRKLLAHLRQHGCRVAGEGARHTRVLNPANGRRSTVPRHREKGRAWPGRSASSWTYFRLPEVDPCPILRMERDGDAAPRKHSAGMMTAARRKDMSRLI